MSSSEPNPALPGRPLLLLDVDGVLTVLGPAPAEGILAGNGLPAFVQIAHGAPRRLRQLSDHFDLIWATMWESEANELLAPALGLPSLPVISFDLSAGDLGADLKLAVDPQVHPLATVRVDRR